MSYEFVADGDLAAVVTYLEMRAPLDHARHLRPLRDDRSAARLCAVRSQPDPGAGAGLRARAVILGGRAAARRRRSRARGRAGRHDGDRRRASSASLAGLARLGFVTELLSKPIRYGYMNGIALTVLLSQMPKLFGFSVEADGPLRELCRPSPQAIADGQARTGGVRHRRRHARADPAAEALTSACPAF